jgi:hypothetical protein
LLLQGPLGPASNGQKLSKHNGTPAFNTERFLETLVQALIETGIPNVDRDTLMKLSKQ